MVARAPPCTLAASLALWHVAAGASLLSLPDSRAVVSASRQQLLSLRGGEDSSNSDSDDNADAAVEKRGLTRREIAAKLNEMPTFCVTNEDGGVAMFRVRDDDGKFKSTVCFFLEPEEAKASLQAMQDAMPNTKLKLTLIGLGAAFEHCRGWHSVAKSKLVATAADADDDAAFLTSDPPPTTPNGEAIEMRIMGNHALVNATSSAMTTMLDEHKITADGWTLPVFICNELQSKSIYPAFLKPSDLKKTWVAAGRSEDSIPNDIMVVDLRLIISQMRTDANDWTRLHLVPSEDAILLAQELQGGSAPA